MGFWKTITTALIGLLLKKVCYHDEGIGCFDNKKPYNNAQGNVPQSPDRIGIEFLLYTRNNRNTPQIISRDSASIRGSNFIGIRKTKFIIHGFNDDAKTKWVKDMGAAILRKENVNVIAVNWKNGADGINFGQVAANTRVVGAMIAELMKSLRRHALARYDRMHLIGHSLGAHVAGYAGERVPGTGRITGLDPAGFLFENKDQDVRLDPSDAKFVDVIHTDSEALIKLGFGLKQAIGDVDFYPNGGTDQPGCKDKVSKYFIYLITGKFKELTDSIACSHLRVLDLFIESINSSCRFKAYPCSSRNDFKANRCRTCRSGCTTMGYETDKRKRGTFYLTTASSSPYCLP